jgi:hypothetical protein
VSTDIDYTAVYIYGTLLAVAWGGRERSKPRPYDFPAKKKVACSFSELGRLGPVPFWGLTPIVHIGPFGP